MSVSLLEVVRAAQIRAASLTAETAGYLLLAVVEGRRGLEQGVEPEQIGLRDNGDIELASAGPGREHRDGEPQLRSLLGKLLALSPAGHPALLDVSRGKPNGSFARELEAALIPVNRAAARRALARVHRETERARGAGKLQDLTLARAHLASAPGVEAGPPHRAPLPESVAVVTAHDRAPTREMQPQRRRSEASRAAAYPAPSFESADHTIRIDALRPGAPPAAAPFVEDRGLDVVAHQPTDADNGRGSRRGRRGGDRRATERRLGELYAPMDASSRTPFLGSVVTAIRSEPVRPAPPEQPDQPALAFQIEQPAQEVALPAAEPPQLTRASAPLAAPDLTASAPESATFHTPAWEPQVRTELRPEHTPRVDLAPVVTAQAHELSEGESFSLLIEQHSECAPEVVPSATEAVSEIEAAQGQAPEETARRMEHWALYAPRKSDLDHLLARFESVGVDEHDVARELKQLAGIDASPSSQTPPPVGFSDLDAPAPEATLARAETGSNDNLRRRAGVGLAGLISACILGFLFQAPAQAPRQQAALEPPRCLASIKVRGAPPHGEIRLRAPAPHLEFSPLSARGEEAVFPGLPCNTPLEVMIRDLDAPDGPWAIIPVAAEELTAETELLPLQVSATAR